MGSNYNLAGPPNGQLGLFRKPLVPGNNMPSPLDNKMAKQLQGTGNVKSSSQYIYSSPQGLTWESHLTTWAFPLNPETGVQFAKSSIPCPQPWLLNYHLDPSPSFSWSAYNPIEPDAIYWISGHYLQMLNSPFDLLTSSLQPQSINLPTWESFPPLFPIISQILSQIPLSIWSLVPLSCNPLICQLRSHLPPPFPLLFQIPHQFKAEFSIVFTHQLPSAMVCRFISWFSCPWSYRWSGACCHNSGDLSWCRMLWWANLASQMQDGQGTHESP